MKRELELEEKTKAFEKKSRLYLKENCPYVARLDGMCFSKYTKGLKRPFDDNFRDLMQATALHLLTYSNAKSVYTQSDEISLVFKESDNASQWWGGRTDKIISDLVAECCNFFNERRSLINKTNAAKFDCRVFSVDTEEDAFDAMYWRELDCRRNAIQAIAQYHFSHTQLDKKSTNDMVNMLLEKGIKLTDFPQKYINGVYAQNASIERQFTVEELEALPPKHQARTKPDLMIKRKITKILDNPRWLFIRNRVGVLTNNEEPIV